MNDTLWIKTVFSLIALILSLLTGFNYLMDPLGTFSHVNSYNNVRPVLNERQVKTNTIYYHGLAEYDSLLLGSSRTSFVNQNSFKGMKVFNYSLDSMHTSEYKGYISFAKKIKGSEFKNIIFGLDFYGSSVLGNFWKNKNKDASYYIDIVEEPLYRFKMLMSYDTVKRSYLNFKSSMKKPITYYDRNNIKHRQKVDEKTREKQFNSMLKIHKDFFKENYRYLDNGRYQKLFNEIIEANPKTKFIAYTTPITAELLRAFMNIGLLNDYKRWLKDLVETFGEVYHFMDVNTITLNVQNYPDDDHLYPKYANLIAARLSHDSKIEVPNDFGFILNSQNIDNYLDKLTLTSINKQMTDEKYYNEPLKSNQ